MNNSDAILKKSETIQQKLGINRRNLTKAIRKKHSATDKRHASATFGLVALIMLCLEVFLISLCDIIVVVLYIKQKLVCLFWPTAGLD